MWIPNAFVLIVILGCAALTSLIYRHINNQRTRLLYLAVTLLTALLSFSVLDTVASILLNPSNMDFFFLDPSFCYVLPFLFFLINTFYLYRPNQQTWRFWFGLPIAITSLISGLLLAFFVLVGFITFDYGMWPVMLTALLSAILITTTIAFLTEALYPARYQLYNQRVVALFNKLPVVTVGLLLYLLVISAHGLIRQRELLFSRVMYDRYHTEAVGMSVAELSSFSGMKFTHLEDGETHQFWYSCAQPQIWQPCKGLRLYVDKKTNLITQVQARGPLVGDKFIYGLDYGRWLSNAFLFKFQGLDTYARW